MLARPLIHRHKRAARLLLYLLPLALAGAGWAAVRYWRAQAPRVEWWKDVDWEAEEPVRLLAEYLRIDTSAPDGNEIAGAEWLARQLAAAGVEAHVERLGERNANLWAVLEGDDPGALVLHHHIDVDPAGDLDAWGFPPFGGVVEPPWVYGRGAFDMKSIAIAQLAAFLELARAETPLARSLVFLATGDEERGSRLGAGWLVREHPELVARFAGLLTEGGAIEAVALDEVKYWGTELGQKRYVDVRVCDGSRQRLEDLRETLLGVPEHLRVDLTPVEPRLLPPVADFLRAYGPTRSRGDLAALLAQPERLTEPGVFWRLPDFAQALVSDELAVFPVEPAEGGGWEMLLVLQLLPGTDVAAAVPRLLPAGVLDGFAHVVDPGVEGAGTGGFTPPDHPLLQAIDAFVEERFPDVVHGPFFVPWAATDARVFRAAGVPSFGFTPFLVLSAEGNRMKGPNERIALPQLVDGVALYVDLVRRLVVEEGWGDAAAGG